MRNTLVVDGRPIPEESVVEFNQSYDDVVQAAFRRTADNTGVLRTTGSAKLRTTITGKGFAPPALAALDRGTTHTLRCAGINSVESETTSVTLPAARRTDTGFDPIGYALVNGYLVRTEITGIATNVATLTAVAGTSGYVVHYWPEIVAVILVNTARVSGKDDFEWQIEAEEI